MRGRDMGGQSRSGKWNDFVIEMLSAWIVLVCVCVCVCVCLRAKVKIRFCFLCLARLIVDYYVVSYVPLRYSKYCKYRVPVLLGRGVALRRPSLSLFTNYTSVPPRETLDGSASLRPTTAIDTR
jgi:hypothetical protein